MDPEDRELGDGRDAASGVGPFAGDRVEDGVEDETEDESVLVPFVFAIFEDDVLEDAGLSSEDTEAEDTATPKFFPASSSPRFPFP